MAVQILVVKPKSLAPQDKTLLRNAGVVCIEAADPSSVRMIQPEGPVVSGDELLHAAMKAIRSHSCASLHSNFTEIVARLVEQHMEEPKP